MKILNINLYPLNLFTKKRTTRKSITTLISKSSLITANNLLDKYNDTQNELMDNINLILGKF